MLSHLGLLCFVVPEDVRLAERPVEEEEVDWDLMGCCCKDLTAGCVPLPPLLWEHRESLLSDFTSLGHSQKEDIINARIDRAAGSSNSKSTIVAWENMIHSWLLVRFCMLLMMMVLLLVIQWLIAGLCWLVKWLMLVDPYWTVVADGFCWVWQVMSVSGCERWLVCC